MNIGDILDNKYKILKRLGVGAFGIVYLAEDKLAKRNVAIKALLEKESLNQEDLIREIEFLASLNHHSIVTFFHHFFNNDILYLVMEYCECGSLHALIQSKNNLAIDEALSIALEICEVFNFIHNKSIIHRDIKPTNILIKADRKIKVSDFGIANTHSGTIIYLAPEVYSAQYISAKDPRVDIYALGITLLEMIIGNNPFLRMDGQEILANKFNHNFIPTDLPQWLQAIILKATHPIPELRFQTVQEFKQAILSKSVPYVINKDRIRVDKTFEIANKYLNNKNWQKSINYIEKGLESHSDSVLGLMSAGKYYLKIHRMDKAKEYLDQAININPAVTIKKELAEIHIAGRNYSLAISLLQNHIQLNPTDWEAYNLVIECFFKMERFETALEILNTIMSEAKQDCFWNNLFLVKYFIENDYTSNFHYVAQKVKYPHFIQSNFKIMNDLNKSLINGLEPHNKLLYQDYRFNKYIAKNTIVIQDTNGRKIEYTEPIITIGRNKDNDFPIEDTSISRRHCIIVNYSNDVWIYDMGSILGVSVDGRKIVQKQFLLGKHKIKLGNYSFDLYTSEGLLI
jgi:pentatricopeptide repeat protein